MRRSLHVRRTDPSRKAYGTIAPALADYTDNVLFGVADRELGRGRRQARLRRSRSLILGAASAHRYNRERWRYMSHLELVALVVREYEPAIDFFVRVLRFDLVEDESSLTNDGRPKRWVVVRPPGAATGILLARADGDLQARILGKQFAGRVGFFLRVDDFTAAYERMLAAGVEFVTAPRVEPYGRVAVFVDLEGNRWDLLGPV